MDIQVTQAWIGLIGAILGGAGLEVAKHLLSKEERTDETAASLREELRTDVHDLREELRKVEAELDIWRSKYYALMEQFMVIKDDLHSALRYVKDQNLDGPPKK